MLKHPPGAEFFLAVQKSKQSHWFGNVCSFGLKPSLVDGLKPRGSRLGCSLQDGVQQGGRGAAPPKRLQVLQQRRAGRHGAGNVPQRSGTPCHAQSSLPPGTADT